MSTISFSNNLTPANSHRLPIIDDPLNANLGKQLEKMVEKLQKLYTTNDVNNGQQFLRLHLNGPLSLLGYIYFHKHQYDKVEKILLEALASLEGTPQKYFLHPTIHILLVQVYMKQQKMAEARKIGEDAFQLSAIKEGLNDKRLFLKLYPTFDGLI